MRRPRTRTCGRSCAIARHLRGLGLSAPAILAADEAAGLLLLEDLGDDTFTRLLAAGADERASLPAGGRRADPPAPAAAAGGDSCRAAALRRASGCSTRRCCWSTGTCRRSAGTAGRRRRARRPTSPRGETALPPVLAQPRDPGAARLPRRQPDAAAGRAGLAACGLLDFQDAVAGAGRLRPDVAARGCPPRRRRRLRRPRCSPATSRRLAPRRPGERLRRQLRGAGGAAPRQGDRHLHPALTGATASPATWCTSRASGACWKRRSHHPALAAGRALVRPPRPAGRRRAPQPATRRRSQRAPGDRVPAAQAVAAPGDGAGRRPRPAHAADHPSDAEAADRGRRPDDARPRPRRAWRRTASSRWWSTPIIWPTCIDRHLAGRARAPPVRLCIEAELLETGGGVAQGAAAAGRRTVLRASTATSSGATARQPTLAALAAAWDDGADGRAAAAASASRRRSAMTAPAISSCSATAGWCGAARASSRRYLFAGVQILRSAPVRGRARRAPSRSTCSTTARSRPAGCSASSMTARWFHVGTPRRHRRWPRRSCANARRLREPMRQGLHHRPRRAVRRRAGGGAACVRWARRRKRWPTARILLPTRRACRALTRPSCARRAAGRCCCRA